VVHLPGRTDKDISYRWHVAMKKSKARIDAIDNTCAPVSITTHNLSNWWHSAVRSKARIIASDWKCKWSNNTNKISLELCQSAIEAVSRILRQKSME